MKRIAIPVIGGVITSAVHTLILIPVYFTLHKRWEQWRERRALRASGRAESPDPDDENWYRK